MGHVFDGTRLRERDSRRRWALGVRGGIALAAGLTLLIFPLGGLVALVGLVATLFALDGVIAFALAFSNMHHEDDWWVTALQGIASLAIATLALSWPAATLLAMVWLTAAWAIWQGITEIMVSRGLADGRWLAVGGALSVILGLVMIAMPVIGALSLVVVIALYAVVRGIYLVAAALGGRLSAGVLN